MKRYVIWQTSLTLLTLPPTMDTKVKEDLNADSLDVVELMMDLERIFGVTISDEEAAKMSTIGDIVNYIEANQ